MASFHALIQDGPKPEAVFSGESPSNVQSFSFSFSSAEEAAHYGPLFPALDVHGLDYRGDTPWDAGSEIGAAVRALKAKYDGIILIANSIGVYFSMCAGIEDAVGRAFFISPIVDMEGLIRGMMAGAGVTEAQLREQGTVRIPGGQTLSWDYLQYVRSHPIRWNVPTEILYGSADALTSRETVEAFAQKHGARLTVMEGGEHWFHTPEQMGFLDDWIRRTLRKEERNGLLCTDL